MTRLLAATVLLLFTLGGCCAATQFVAARLNYDAALGPPSAVANGVAFYPPWSWFGWDRQFGRQYPLLFRQAGSITSLAALGGALGAFGIGLRRRSREPSGAHGSSRWATTAEVRAAGLLGGRGVVLCQTSDARFRTTTDAHGKARIRASRLGSLVCHDGPEHVFCFAPTRSGKGVGLVVPTLLNWPHSVLVHDIKRENWSLTAGWRRTFSRVWRFEPTAVDSIRFNPLLEVRKGLHEVKDVQNIADILVDPTGEKQSRDHWQLAAHSLLSGTILHTLYAEPDKSLAGVAALLSDPARDQQQLFVHMLRTTHLPEGPHPVVAQVAREMLNKADRELSGVVSTALSCLGLYRDPVIARNTGASDFRITDLMNADAPVSLYLVVPPSDLARTRPIVRLMLNQIGRRLTESMNAGANAAYKHRLLLLLDEFPSLGRLEFFESALAFIAGYGLKALLIAQSLNQLEKAYGPNNSILDNCHVRLTYAANDDRTAKRVSDLLGLATQRHTQKSYSGSGLILSHRTESVHEFARPLLTPAEVLQLPQDDAILLLGGALPYRARKVRYFADPRFQGRDTLPAPEHPDQQARELLHPVHNDWATAAAADASLAPSAKGPAPERVSPVVGATHEGTRLWNGFFAESRAKAEATEPDDSEELPEDPAEEDLPL